MKRKAFTIIEVLVILCIIGILASMFFSVAEHKKHMPKSATIEQNHSVEKIESTLVDDLWCTVFRDKETGRRIFCYNGGVVVLPEKNNQ